jgi:hypothetical protein
LALLTALAKSVASLLLALSAFVGGGEKMATSFEALMYGISIQETGGHGSGDYHKVNSIGAVGKYQVMKGNIPEWSRRVLGYSISWQKFRDSPSLQEKIVRGILHSYYKKWGARGAAAAWYAGPGNHDLDQNTHSQYGGPSIKSYVDSVLNHATKYSGGGAIKGGGGGGGSPKDEPMSDKERAEMYGFVDALLDSNPELKKKFKDAVKHDWSAQKFQAELRDTKWWKTHSQSERKYLLNRYGDPATAKQDLRQAYIKVRQLANAMGMRETPGNVKRMNTWAYNMVAKGWDESQLRYNIGKYVYFSDDTWQGEGGEAQEKLRSYAYDMGVTMSSQWYADKSRNIIRGIGTEQDYEDEIRRQAKATYAQWGKQIDAGQTVADLASPYLQSMAQILELPAGSISLQNKTIKKALQYKDPKTGANAVKPLWQFENDLRSDPRWKKTKNAQDSLMQVAHQVLADFGVKY